MKLSILVSIFGMLLSGVAFADCGFVPGKYEGTGHWSNFDQGKGEYQVTTLVTEKKIVSKYLKEGKEVSIIMTTTEGGEGNCVLTVRVPGVEGAGKGLCSKEDAGCRYRVKVPGMRLEESFMFRDNGIYRIGFKIHPSQGDAGIFSWSEHLEMR